MCWIIMQRYEKYFVFRSLVYEIYCRLPIFTENVFSVGGEIR